MRFFRYGRPDHDCVLFAVVRGRSFLTPLPPAQIPTRHIGIRLLPRESDGEPHTRPGMQGCRILGLGRNSSASFAIRSHTTLADYVGKVANAIGERHEIGLPPHSGLGHLVSGRLPRERWIMEMGMNVGTRLGDAERPQNSGIAAPGRAVAGCRDSARPRRCCDYYAGKTLNWYRARSV